MFPEIFPSHRFNLQNKKVNSLDYLSHFKKRPLSFAAMQPSICIDSPGTLVNNTTFSSSLAKQMKIFTCSSLTGIFGKYRKEKIVRQK